MSQLDLLSWCQRWRGRRSSYRPAGEVIDPSRYGVEVLEERGARAFVEAHHYSGSYPAARCRVGLHRARPLGGLDLVGVAVFSVPAGPAVLGRWCGADPGIELGRFVLLDDVPGNGETWFLARAFRALAAVLSEVRTVLAFADPLERTTALGQVIKPGHEGTIYRAHNGSYRGRSTPRTVYLTPAGLIVSDRAISKLRVEDKGWRYVARDLCKAGAPARLDGESGGSYWRRILSSGLLRRVRHPGNHTFTWPIAASRQQPARRVA